jgi:hypothetical protein
MHGERERERLDVWRKNIGMIPGGAMVIEGAGNSVLHYSFVINSKGRYC